jgi:hypothetical protein
VLYRREVRRLTTMPAGPVIEIPAAPPNQVEPPVGHLGVWEECSACRRDFLVSTPKGPAGTGLALDVPCPHCRSARTEVAVKVSSMPIYVQATRRSWVGWQARAMRHAVREVRTSLRIATYKAIWRTKALVGRSKSAEQASERSPK